MLQRAEGDDEHRAAFDGEGNVACDQIEMLLERRVQAPTPADPGVKRRNECEGRTLSAARGGQGLTTTKAPALGSERAKPVSGRARRNPRRSAFPRISPRRRSRGWCRARTRSASA